MPLRLATILLLGLLSASGGLASCGPPTTQEGPTPNPSLPPVTPAPSSVRSKGLTPTELKYRLFQEFGETFFCDPDFYPVPRGDEMELARERFPLIQRETEKYQAILQHLRLADTVQFSDEQKLAIYREYKRLNSIDLRPSGSTYEFRLRVPENKQRGHSVEGEISPSGSVKITKKEPAVLTCPICIAAGTLIDTPAGQVAVEKLASGMPVWTVDPRGNRVPATILETSRMPAPESHQVVRLLLDDGRELRASPAHPTADGRAIGDLSVGDSLDGARVVFTDLIAYTQGYTYDLLPSGDTGQYWANGIPVRSTLVRD